MYPIGRSFDALSYVLWWFNSPYRWMEVSCCDASFSLLLCFVLGGLRTMLFVIVPRKPRRRVVGCRYARTWKSPLFLLCISLSYSGISLSPSLVVRCNDWYFHFVNGNGGFLDSKKIDEWQNHSIQLEKSHVIHNSMYKYNLFIVYFCWWSIVSTPFTYKRISRFLIS